MVQGFLEDAFHCIQGLILNCRLLVFSLKVTQEEVVAANVNLFKKSLGFFGTSQKIDQLAGGEIKKFRVQPGLLSELTQRFPHTFFIAITMGRDGRADPVSEKAIIVLNFGCQRESAAALKQDYQG
jgi:hypothetical protein